MSADLVAHKLQGKTGFVAIYRTAVYQQTTGLVDGNQVLVLIYHFACLLNRHWTSVTPINTALQ